MDSFRNFICYVLSIHNTRESNIVQLFPYHTQMPKTSSTNRLAAVVEDLITTLQNPHPLTPFLQRGDLTSDAIKQLQIIFNAPNNSNNVTNNNNNNNNTTNNGESITTCCRPRVRMSMVSINEESRIYPLDTTIRKKFN